MFTLIFLFGIISGFTLALASLWLVRIKCPQCKKLKPLRQIILFHLTQGWKKERDSYARYRQNNANGGPTIQEVDDW